jgi:hypothetical protein
MNTERLIERAKGEIEQSLLEGTGSGGLLSTGYFSDGSLVDRLRYNEKLDYLLQNLTKGLTVRVDGTERHIESGSNYRTAVLITDSRLLFVVGQADGDETFSIPFSQTNDVDASTGILKNRITVYSEKGTYDMYVQKESEIEEIAAHVTAAANSSQTGRRSAADSTTNDTGESDVMVTDDRNSSTADGGEADPEVSGTGAADDAGPDSVEPDVDGGTDDQSIEPSSAESPEPSRDELLEELARLNEETDRRVTRGRMRADGMYEPEDYEKKFGTWSTAFEAMPSAEESTHDDESDATGTQETYSKSEVLDEIAAVTEQVDGEPSTDDMQEYGRISPTPAYRYFDSWSDAVAAAIETRGNASNGRDATDETESDTKIAGRTPTDGQSPKDEDLSSFKTDLIDDIRRVKDDLGKVPSKAEMSVHGDHSISQFEKAFGTWTEAVQAAGFEPRGSPDRYTHTEVLDGLRDVASEVKKPPSPRDINEHAPFSGNVIYNFFDSFEDAREAAGVNDVDVVLESDSEPESDVDTAANGSSSSSTPDAKDASPDSTDRDSSLPHKGPLADGLASASEGRLSGVAAEVVDVSEVGGSKRAAEIDLRTTADEGVVLDVWEKHDVDWSFEKGDRLRLDEVRLKRWETGSTPAHQLSTTKDFSATGLEDASGDERDTPVTPVERLTGLAGATKEDAEILVEAGYECREDLESATLEELRDIPNLDDGVALRIKAELG